MRHQHSSNRSNRNIPHETRSPFCAERSPTVASGRRPHHSWPLDPLIEMQGRPLRQYYVMVVRTKASILSGTLASLTLISSCHAHGLTPPLHSSALFVGDRFRRRGTQHIHQLLRSFLLFSARHLIFLQLLLIEGLCAGTCHVQLLRTKLQEQSTHRVHLEM